MPLGTTHFEKLVRDKMQETLEAHNSVEDGNINKHDRLRGQYAGLKLSLDLFKQASRKDAEAE